MKSLRTHTAHLAQPEPQILGPAVSLREVTVRYRPESPPALDIDRLVIGRGERIAVIGPSGAGKTTLLRLINGYVQPAAGHVTVLGTEINAYASRRRDVRRRVGFVFQDCNLIERATTFQNVLWGRLGRVSPRLSLLGWVSEADKRAGMGAIAEVGLAQQATQRADTLSGGQQQRVGVARVLAQGAEVILADEPVSNLDPALADDILGMLVDVSERYGATLIMSVHQPALAQRYADRIIGLHDGRIVSDSAAGTLSDQALHTIYGRKVIADAPPVAARVGHMEDQPEGIAEPSPTTSPPRGVRAARGIPDYPHATVRDSVVRAAGLLLLVALIAWAWSGADVQLQKLAAGLPRMAEFFSRMVPPNMTVAKTVIVSTGETVQIALFGTVLSAVASFFLG
ncbi:MAG: ATP-binding cassette domain-containing protein, partial [Planctomycetota bacterium]